MGPDELRATREHYDSTDLSAHIDGATWEEHEPAPEPMTTYALRLPKNVIDRLRAAALARNMKVSTLMREWLEERLTIETEGGSEATIPVSALLALVAERGEGHTPRAS